ncbi:MAG TPA: septum formation initiator family protein [Actinobacteria bacterium]|nr:septum formation initiator family protein [Actinomycetota bacterium]
MRGSRVAILAVVGVLVVGAVLVTNVLPIRSLMAQQRRVDLAQEQLGALQEANARLQASADFLSSDAGVEMVARRDFGLVRPGETAYVVIDPNDEGFTPDVPKTTAVEPEQPRPWWQYVWDFVTGRDLTV